MRSHASRLRLGLGLVLGLSAAGAAAAPQPDAAERFDMVVIDAGHGGDDDGARGPQALLEKDLVLDVARALAGKLSGAGLRAVLTRARGSLRAARGAHARSRTTRAPTSSSRSTPTRARRARRRGIETFFVSLDADGRGGPRARAGARTARSRSRAARRALEGDPLLAILGDMIATEHLVESSEFARLALGELRSQKGAVSRGVKQAPFVVLMGVQMPAALVEIGFITNAREEGALATDAERERIAENAGERAFDSSGAASTPSAASRRKGEVSATGGPLVRRDGRAAGSAAGR